MHFVFFLGWNKRRRRFLTRIHSIVRACRTEPNWMSGAENNLISSFDKKQKKLEKWFRFSMVCLFSFFLFFSAWKHRSGKRANERTSQRLRQLFSIVPRWLTGSKPSAAVKNSLEHVSSQNSALVPNSTCSTVKTTQSLADHSVWNLIKVKVSTQLVIKLTDWLILVGLPSLSSDSCDMVNLFFRFSISLRLTRCSNALAWFSSLSLSSRSCE